ncbi:MAG: universal stress protein, partial [Chloroflexota bacterium]|nr:universal stress protein [Chloroflexota bacterium]
MSENILSAIQDFHRARNQAKLQQIAARLTGKPSDLLSYEEVRRKLKARAGGTRTLKTIPLDAIVGSVGRYNDFTRTFLPRQDSDEERWARVKTVMHWKGLPPIQVYQIDQVYFVLDGNHRVSIARQSGVSDIQAYVTEVRIKVPLSPDVQPDDLIIKAEYVDFLEHTSLDKLRPEADLSVTVPGRYQALEEQIRVHHYFMGLEREREIPYEETVAHWYDEVYLPIVQVIRQRGILRDFPDRTETDLYLWVSEHRAELKEELGWEIEPEAAADDLAVQFSPKLKRVAARVGEKVLDAVTPDELEAGPPPGEWRRERLAARRTDQMFADLVVAINGAEAGWRALEHALFVARHEEARVHGLHVAASEAQRESEGVQTIRAEFDRRCKEAGVPGELAVEVGKVPRSVCWRARWADLVILSLSYPPASQPIARLGSGLSAIIRRSPRPVLMVPETAPRLNRALLAYDGSHKSEEALFVAAYLSVRWEIPLVVVTVIETGRTTSELLLHA